jgi:hypothetical protein
MSVVSIDMVDSAERSTVRMQHIAAAIAGSAAFRQLAQLPEQSLRDWTSAKDWHLHRGDRAAMALLAETGGASRKDRGGTR